MLTIPHNPFYTFYFFIFFTLYLHSSWVLRQQCHSGSGLPQFQYCQHSSWVLWLNCSSASPHFQSLPAQFQSGERERERGVRILVMRIMKKYKQWTINLSFLNQTTFGLVLWANSRCQNLCVIPNFFLSVSWRNIDKDDQALLRRKMKSHLTFLSGQSISFQYLSDYHNSWNSCI